MGVLLLSTYELGHQPLGLAAPLAHLRAAGIAARGLDLAVGPLDEGAVAEATFVGISTPMHTALRLGVQAAERVHELNPRVHICFYGLYATLNAGHLLETCADSVLGGEVEEPLVRLVEELALDEAAVRGRNETYLGRQTFLPPEREGLPPLDRYAYLQDGDSRRLAGCIEASRGCAHRCLHCPITPVYGGRLRIVPLEAVLADVRRLAQMGAEHLTFADPDFFNGIRHSMAVARAIHHEFPWMSFDATIKIEHLLEHEALLPELRDLGCRFILSAVESLSDTVLYNLEKGHTAADVSRALAACRRAGIALRPSLLPFTPWETLDSYLALLDFVEANGLVYHVDPVQLAIRLLVPPGSSLLGSGAMRPFLGPLNEADFAYEWRHPDPRMDVLARDVSLLVEAAACRNQDPVEAFAAVHDLARRAAGLPAIEPCCRPAYPGASRPPGLSESWFCCAEPTREQVSLVTSLATSKAAGV